MKNKIFASLITGSMLASIALFSAAPVFADNGGRHGGLLNLGTNAQLQAQTNVNLKTVLHGDGDRDDDDVVIGATTTAAATATAPFNINFGRGKHLGEIKNEGKIEAHATSTVAAQNNPAVLSALIDRFTTFLDQLKARLAFLLNTPHLPLISNISVSAAATSTATVNWQTDAPTTGQIFFSTSTPVNTATAASVSDATLAMSHSVTLSGLAPTSTIFFVVQAKNASGTISTSAQQSFRTTQ